MLLRTRITAMVAAGLVLAALGWSAAALLREQLLDQRLTAAVQTAQSALWSQVLATHDRELDELPARIAALEGEQAELNRQLADPDIYRKEGGNVAAMHARVEVIDAELMGLLERWEALGGS